MGGIVMMNKYFTIGAITGWLFLSMISGKLWLVLSLPTILAVAVGGLVGEIVGMALSRDKER